MLEARHWGEWRSDHEKPVRDFVHGAGSVLASFAVYDQIPDLDWLLFAGIRADLHGAPLAESNGMRPGSSKAAAERQQKADEYA